MREEQANRVNSASFYQKVGGWIAILGPGAIIASLTIGAGELIFSSRAGSLFSYNILWVFALVLIGKWALAYGSARHLVLTGAHPIQRWMELPGPRGWLPVTFLILGLLCFPIWVCFHAATVGSLLAYATKTGHLASGSAHFFWGAVVLILLLGLALKSGYSVLEKIQMIIVAVMLLAVLAAFIMLHPPWLEVLRGFIPQPLQYPSWAATIPELRERSIWVETINYVGIVGGSSFDYLAYVSYMRHKHWGRSGENFNQGRAESNAGAKQALKYPLADSLVSFTAVMIFAGVFVACGAILLRPDQKIPSGSNLLTLQAAFVTPQLTFLYFIGAFLTMLGTLYGTIEVAPAILAEMVRAIAPDKAADRQKSLRKAAVLWVSLGGLAVLLFNGFYQTLVRPQNAPALVALLTPANLFTGVLGCGIVALLNVWMEMRWLAPKDRSNTLNGVNVLCGIAFISVGLHGYHQYKGWTALIILACTVGAGIFVSWLLKLTTLRH